MQQPKCILSLDIATKCGWAVKLSGEPIISGTWNLKFNPNTESESMRAVKMRAQLNTIFKAYPIDTIVYEEVAFASRARAHAVHHQLLGVVKLYFEDNDIPFLTAVPVSTVKRIATGKGNASKEKMAEAAAKKWPGYEFVDDNEIDARFILEAAIQEKGFEIE